MVKNIKLFIIYQNKTESYTLIYLDDSKVLIFGMVITSNQLQSVGIKLRWADDALEGWIMVTAWSLLKWLIPVIYIWSINYLGKRWLCGVCW